MNNRAETPATLPSGTTLNAVAEELLALWGSYDEFVAGAGYGNSRRLRAALGLAAHCVVSADSALILLNPGRPIPAVTLVRTAMVSAAAARWLALTRDAEVAFVHSSLEEERKARVDLHSHPGRDETARIAAIDVQLAEHRAALSERTKLLASRLVTRRKGAATRRRLVAADHLIRVGHGQRRGLHLRQGLPASRVLKR